MGSMRHLARSLGIFLLVCTWTAEGLRASVGFVLSESGSNAELGREVRRGAEIAFEELRKAGRGEKLSPIFLDDASSTSRMAGRIRELAMNRDVLAVVGASRSWQLGLWERIARQRGLPILLCREAQRPVRTTPRPWVYRILPSEEEQCRALARYLSKERGLRDGTLILCRSEHSGYDPSTVLSAQGLQVLQRPTWSSASPPALDAERLGDFVLLLGDGTRCAEAARAVRALGFRGLLLGGQGLLEEGFLRQASGSDRDMLLPWGPPKDDPGWLHLAASYRARYGGEASLWAASGYDALYLLDQAIRSGGSGRKELRQALQGLNKVWGSTGPIEPTMGRRRIWLPSIAALGPSGPEPIHPPVQAPLDSSRSVSRQDPTQQRLVKTWASYPAFPVKDPQEIGPKTSFGPPHRKVFAIKALDERRVWFGTEHGAALFDGTGWKVFTEADGLAHHDVVAIATPRDRSQVWFATFGGISRWLDRPDERGRHFQSWTTKNSGLVNDVCYGIAVQKAGEDVWVATTNGASHFHLPTNAWTTYNESNAPFNEVWCYNCVVDVNDVVWYGIWGGGVCRYREGTWTAFVDPDHLFDIDTKRNDGNLHEIVTGVSHSNGALWAGAYFGLSRFDGTRWWNWTIKDPDCGMPSDFINFVQSRGDTVWLGTDKGLCSFNWNTKRWVTYSRDPRSPRGKISIFEKGRWTHRETESAIPDNFVWAMEFQGDRLWIGTSMGAACGYFE